MEPERVTSAPPMLLSDDVAVAGRGRATRLPKTRRSLRLRGRRRFGRHRGPHSDVVMAVRLSWRPAPQRGTWAWHPLQASAAESVSCASSWLSRGRSSWSSSVRAVMPASLRTGLRDERRRCKAVVDAADWEHRGASYTGNAENQCPIPHDVAYSQLIREIVRNRPRRPRRVLPEVQHQIMDARVQL